MAGPPAQPAEEEVRHHGAGRRRARGAGQSRVGTERCGGAGGSPVMAWRETSPPDVRSSDWLRGLVSGRSALTSHLASGVVRSVGRGTSRSVGALLVPLRSRPREGRDRSWRHEIPDGADDCVELRAEPVVLGEDDVPEVLVLSNSLDGSWGWGTAWHCHRLRQALIACRCSSLVTTLTRRGLACSATGIRRVRTPPS